MPDDRFSQAIARFDAANAEDPIRVTVDGQPVGRELVYARRLSAWVDKLTSGQASEPLRLAARCQHLCRWAIPRDQYPDGRVGYLKWREQLKKLHAEKAAGILQAVGYDAATIDRVRTIVLKKDLASDPDVQAMEDALCLFFLEEQFADLAAKEAPKIVDIVKKTWVKMSPRAHELALALPLAPAERAIVEKALQ
ncbi:MAG TPA: DUF4202 domain-containing protein [Planctomycetota bacterium]|nr:DUF4202 domain-containing protein [Planctomycetota bacterium]